MQLVRYGTDLGAEMLRLGHLMKLEGAFANCDWDEQKLLNLFEQPHVFCVLAKNTHGEYVAFFLGAVHQQYFGNDWVATDLATFVHPEHRGGSYFLRLVKEFEAWAQSLGVKEIYLSQSTGINIEKTKSMFERLGYQAIGYSTKKEIKRPVQ